MWGRIHLIPMLQAEEDRDLVRRNWADIEREKKLLGTETKVYHSNRYGQCYNGLQMSYLIFFYWTKIRFEFG